MSPHITHRLLNGATVPFTSSSQDVLATVKANLKVRVREMLQFSEKFTKTGQLVPITLIFVFESEEGNKFTSFMWFRR